MLYVSGEIAQRTGVHKISAVFFEYHWWGRRAAGTAGPKQHRNRPVRLASQPSRARSGSDSPALRETPFSLKKAYASRTKVGNVREAFLIETRA